MKTLNIFFFISVFFLISDSYAQSKSKNKEITIKTSVVCNMCKNTMEKALAYEKGVKKSNVIVEDQKVTVVFDPRKTSVEKIKKAITMSGYDADEMVANPKAYEKLNECCKKDMGVH